LSAIWVKAAAGRTIPFPDGRKLPGDPSAQSDGSIMVDGDALFVQRCLASGDLLIGATPSGTIDPGYTSDSEQDS
jgi:hypothetical protein